MKLIQQSTATSISLLVVNRHALDCVFLLAMFATTTSGQPVVWSTRVGGNGHAYEFVHEDGIDWPDAKAAAESRVYGTRPGHLATVTSAAENSFFNNLLSSAAAEIAPQPLVEAWLGGYQKEGESRPDQGWMWVTPERWQYTNWRSGEPNDVGDERYLGTFGPGNNGPIGEWNCIAQGSWESRSERLLW